MSGEKNKPLLSVIIPCYKVEKYLDRCLESVIAQTYHNLEIILVDDGSPDRSGQICDDWARRDNRVRVIHKANGGLGYARNSGLEVATGEYVAFIDSDDYIDLTMYEKLMRKAEEFEADIVYCGHIKQMSDGSESAVHDFNDVRVFEKDKLPELSRGFFQPISEAPKMLTMSVWHAVYRQSVIKTQFYSEREVGSEDIHFQICAVLNAERIVFIPDALYVYCYNGESLSHTFNLSKYDRYKRLNEIINEAYRPYGIHYPGEYCVFLMAFALIRRIALANISFEEKKRLAANIVKDQFWQRDHLSSLNLSGAKKIFYRTIKIQSVSLMMLLAKFYCIFNYTLAKKRQG